MEENKVPQVQVAVPQLSKQDFLNAVVQTLGYYNWPQGSIESINPDKTRLVYLWGNKFKGTAEGMWTAKVNGDKKITINDKDASIKDGTPYSGDMPAIEFELLVLNDNAATPYWAKNFCEIGFESDSFQPFSSVEATGGTIEGDGSGNPLSAWMKNGNTIVDNFLHPFAEDLSQNTALAYLALGLLPPEVVQQSYDVLNSSDFDSRDVTVSSRNSVPEEPTAVLIPFYLLEFTFEGKPYHIAMMADNRCIIKGQIPPVQDSGLSPQQQAEQEMPDKVKQANLMKWGWLVALLLMFFVKFIVGVIVLVAWAVGYWFMKKPINDRIKQLEQQANANADLKAQQLRNQLLR